jgi:hypothetical protein
MRKPAKKPIPERDAVPWPEREGHLNSYVHGLAQNANSALALLLLLVGLISWQGQ